MLCEFERALGDTSGKPEGDEWSSRLSGGGLMCAVAVLGFGEAEIGLKTGVLSWLADPPPR